MKANSLKRVDNDRDIYLQAFMNQVAKAKKKVGKDYKPVYPKFKDLYDYEEIEKKIWNPEYKDTRTINLIVKANSL